MTEEEWHRFVWGRDPQIAALGRLPLDLCRAIGCSSSLIHMHHAYALKCSQKHGLDTRDFLMLPITIDLGRCVCDRQRNLTFFYYENVVYGGWFHATIKTNKNGDELWLMTFHRTSHTEVARKCKKAELLRPEKE